MNESKRDEGKEGDSLAVPIVGPAERFVKFLDENLTGAEEEAFFAKLELLQKEADQGCTRTVDNHVWCLKHAEHLNLLGPAETTRYVLKMHPLGGCPRWPPVANTKEARLMTIEELAQLAMPTDIVCCEVLGRLVSLIDKKRLPYIHPGSIANVAYTALHHSDKSVRLATAALVDLWKEVAPVLW